MGLDEMSWLAPVRPGDRLRCSFTLLEWRQSASRPEAGVARVRYELFNQEEQLVVRSIKKNTY